MTPQEKLKQFARRHLASIVAALLLLAALVLVLVRIGLVPPLIRSEPVPQPRPVQGSALMQQKENVQQSAAWQVANPGKLIDSFANERNFLARVPGLQSASLDRILMPDGRLLSEKRLLAYRAAGHASNVQAAPQQAQVVSASLNAVLWDDGLVNIKGTGLEVRFDQDAQQFLYGNLMRDDLGTRTLAQERQLLDNVAVSSGLDFTLVLKRDGTVWGTGSNRFGQLGIDTRVSGKMIVPIGEIIPDLRDVIAISASVYHGLALKRDGTVWRWGHDGDYGLARNQFWGQPKEFHERFSAKPEQISGLTDIVKIASGDTHYLALKRDGTVWTWGNNNEGQVDAIRSFNPIPGQTFEAAYVSNPRKVEGVDQVTDIAAAAFHSLALRADGTVWAWGRMHHGEMGRPLQKIDEDNYTPASFGAGPEFWSSIHPRPMRDVARVKRLFTAFGSSTLVLQDDTVQVIGNACNLCGQSKIEKTLVEMALPETVLAKPKIWQDTRSNPLTEAVESRNIALANQILAAGAGSEDMRGATLSLLRTFEDPYGGQFDLLKKLLPSAKSVFNSKSDARLLLSYTYTLGCRHWRAAKEVFDTPGLLSSLGDDMPAMFEVNDALPYPQATPTGRSGLAQPCLLRDSLSDYKVAAERKEFVGDYAAAVINYFSDEQLAGMFPRFWPNQTHSDHYFYKVPLVSFTAIEQMALRKQRAMAKPTPQGEPAFPDFPVRLFLNQVDSVKRDDPRVSDPALARAWIKKHNKGVSEAELNQMFAMQKGSRPISTTPRGLQLQHNAILGLLNIMLAAGAEAKPHVLGPQGKVYKGLVLAMKKKQAVFVCPVNDVFDLMAHVRGHADSVVKSKSDLERVYVMNQSLVPRMLSLYRQYGARPAPHIEGYVNCPEIPGKF
jgi:hypothetical protein